MANPTPAAIARYLLTENALSTPPVAPSACANAVIALMRMPTTTNRSILNLLIVPPSIYVSDCRWTTVPARTRRLLFRLHPVSTAPLTTALLRYRPDLLQKTEAHDLP